LHLLAQRRLDDVLTGRGPAEVQLLRERDEVAQLAQLDPGGGDGVGHRVSRWLDGSLDGLAVEGGGGAARLDHVGAPPWIG
jgi:hypothetical protein